MIERLVVRSEPVLSLTKGHTLTYPALGNRRVGVLNSSYE
jgi:hypothetical protein